MKNNYSKIRIITTFNQTLLVATDVSNNAIAWSSASFNNRTVSTSSYKASSEVAAKLQELGVDNADVIVRGPGVGREPAIRALMDKGITINIIKDVTPVPHNGCVPNKTFRKEYPVSKSRK